MSAIPVEVNTFLDGVNLSALKDKTRIDNLVSAHEPSVLSLVEFYTTSEAYESAVSEDPVITLANAFKFAYNLLLLKSILPFLNLNTAGEGIIASTGIDANQTNLLSYEQIKKQQNDLELQALRALRYYLSEEGKRQLINLSGTKKSKVKAALLCEEETGETTPWWYPGDFDEDLW